MDSPASTEKIFQCFDCPDGVQIFATEEALLTHKWDMIRVSRARSHMACHVCKLEHRTFEGLMRHYQLHHPAKQKLSCPGCNEPYARLHLLMRHLESDICPHVNPQRVTENRRQQALITALTAKNGHGSLAAATEASVSGVGGASSAASVSGVGDEGNTASMLGLANQAEHLGIFNLSGVSVGDYGRFLGIEPTKQDYERYVAAGGRLQLGNTELLDPTPGVPSLLPGASRPGLPGAPARRPALGGPSDAVPVLHSQNQTRTQGGGSGVASGRSPAKPSTGSDKKPSAAPSVTSAVRNFRRGDTKAPDLLTDDASRRGFDVWSGQDILVPEGPGQQDAKQPSASFLDGIRKINLGDGSSATSNNVPGLHHPDHPNFSVKKYKNPHSGRYNCPMDRCLRAGKNFKTAAGLIMHLRSSTAHESVRLQCPSCFGFFLNLEALTQHCESQSVRCRFRDNEEFVPFLNILTGGVADIRGRNIDLTVSYGVKETAPLVLLQDEVAETTGEDVVKKEGQT